jgi:hypothetical protein
MTVRKPAALPAITVQGSPCMGEFTISTASHVSISSPAVPPDIAFIRALAAKQGWSADKLKSMHTQIVRRILNAELKKLEGDAYRERSRSTYRRVQGRSA